MVKRLLDDFSGEIRCYLPQKILYHNVQRRILEWETDTMFAESANVGVGVSIFFLFGAMAEVETYSKVTDQSGLRRSARLRKLKENKGKVFSQYFSEPAQSSAQIRQISKKGKRQRDQSRY